MAGKYLIFRFADAEAHEREFSLVKAGETLAVEPKAFRVLLILLRNPKKLIPKEELLNAVWGDAAVTENSLARAIALLRRLLSDDAREPRFIETVTSVGYRWLCPVERIEDSAAISAAEEPDAPANLPTTAAAKAAGKRRWTWLAASAAALILLLAVGYWYLSRPLPPPRVTELTQVTRDGRTKQLEGTDGSRLYFTQSSSDKIAQVSVNGGDIAEVPIVVPAKGWRLDLKDVSRDGSKALIAIVGGEEEKQTASSLWIAPILGGTAKRLDTGATGSFHPDGSDVIYSTDEGDIFLSRIDGTEKRRLANVGSRAYWFKWSPNGKTIRFTRNDGSLWEMNSDGSAVHQLLTDWTGKGFLCCGEWTADGDFYLFHLYKPETDSDLWALDERHGPFRPRSAAPIRLTTGPTQWGSFILSRDGNKIFAEGATSRGELSRIDSKTGNLQPFLGGISAEFVSFSPDGKSVAYVLFPEGTLWKADLDGSNRIQLSGLPNQVYNPRWSPDSKQILFSANTIERRSTAYLVSAEGGIPKKLLPEDGIESDEANWSPDGNKVIFDWGVLAAEPDKRDLRIIDLKSGQIQAVPGSAGFSSVRWSSNGRYLAALAYPSIPVLRIFDFKSERWAALPVNGEVEFPSFSRDSRYIYFLRPRRNQGVFRIPVTGGQEERVVNPIDWHLTGYFGFSMSLDPNDAPLVLRDTGTDDIYALTLEDK